MQEYDDVFLPRYNSDTVLLHKLVQSLVDAGNFVTSLKLYFQSLCVCLIIQLLNVVEYLFC